MNITCIIVEDNTAAATKLNFLLKEFENIKVLNIAHSYAEGLKSIKEHKPDVVFMDYELDKSTGMELLNECSGFYQYVIFTTAYKEFVLDSYQYNTVNYLLKPISREDLKISLERLFFYLCNELTKESNTSVSLSQSLRRIYLPINNSYKSINVDDIFYFESDSSYSNIHLLNNKFKASRNLQYFTEILMPYSEFIRIHKSYIINSKHIVEIIKGIKSKIILKNGAEIPVSNIEKAEVFKMLGV